MSALDNLKYTKDHEWIKIDGNIAVVGITDYAQGELGDIVYVDLCESGKKVNEKETFGAVESLKTVSDLYAPLSGVISNINNDLEDAPELVNQSPYENGWMIKLKISNADEISNLMSASEYEEYVSSL